MKRRIRVAGLNVLGGNYLDGEKVSSDDAKHWVRRLV